MTVEANKAMARRLYEEVFGRGNLAAADEILAVGCVGHGPGSPPHLGSDQIKRQAILLRGAIPDLRVTLNDQLAEGDRVTSRLRTAGSSSRGLSPTGSLRRQLGLLR